ncbi:MAG TPA: DUF4279 domain-containing protein [Polyangiaceae bacterium]|jgi:hypothetical protein
MDRAVSGGFVVETSEAVRLADIQSRGGPDSRFESRLYGPTILFCPFCGASLDVATMGRCSVSLVAAGATLTGSPLVDAPAEPSIRTRELLSALTVRWDLELPPLLTYSMVLEADVVARVAALRAGLDIRLVDGAPPSSGATFDAGIEIWTGADDPRDLTEPMGLEATLVLRAGEPLEPGGRALCKRSVWRFDLGDAPVTSFASRVRDLVGRVPHASTAWATLRSKYDARARLSFQVESLTMALVLDAEMVASLALLGVPIGFFFYNEGA